MWGKDVPQVFACCQIIVLFRNHMSVYYNTWKDMEKVIGSEQSKRLGDFRTDVIFGFTIKIC